jgi:hypothetical protein
LTTGGRFQKDERPFIVTGLVVAGAAVVWAALLPAAAYAASLPADRTAAQVFAFMVYAFGSAICHQRDERSFHLFAEQLPVCARCTGLYAGAAIAAISYVALFRRREPGPGPSGVEFPSSELLRTVTARLLLASAAVPLVASLVYEWGTGDVPSNMVRAGTGIALGGAVAYVILAAVDSTR